MARGNVNPDTNKRGLDLEHELPAANGNDTEPGVPQAAAGDSNDTQQLKAERDALLDRLARLQAEFDNARKRAVREQQDFKDYALADAVKTLLPVVDSFQRALSISGREGTEFRNGVELIYKQFEDALAKLGLQPIATGGELFDPRIHEAIQMVDTTEVPDHQIIEELQRGYRLKDRLVRPSMVTVARNPKR
ncbi:MAG: nucleotide exchange factor GrpE [Acidobacteriales bacterium]|nr:nucleotide exchange factor GrpE [Terriglobales bacterium]